MGYFLRLVVILALLFGCVGLTAGLWLFSQNTQLREEFKPDNVTLDRGVFVQPAVVRSVFGENTPVAVHVSPPGAEAMGAKSVSADGTTHAWVPSTFVGTTASLTPSEAQEYVLRELAKCTPASANAECLFDAAGTPFSAGTLSEMAADPNIKRAGEMSLMFTKFVEAETFKYALDKQYDTAVLIRDVAVSGDASQAAMVAFDSMGEALVAIAVIAICVVVLVMLLKRK